MFHYKETFRDEQVSLILGPGWVLTFQEEEGDVFDPVRERARRGKGRMRRLGPDYLAYSLMDSIVDHYFVVLEKLGENVESLSEQLLLQPSSTDAQQLFAIRMKMSVIRRSIWSLRDSVSNLQRLETRLIQKNTRIFIRDVYDHILQSVDMAEHFSDLAAGLLDLHLSVLSNRMNEVMKVLTIMASIFIPLTFLAGIYGMNFEYMPELEWTWGYGGVLTLMAVIAATMLVYFKKKNWL
jgi:magnesium transporter